MAHAREQIRDALVTVLTGLATTGANVFRNRPETLRIPDANLPALLIYTEGESVDYATIHGPGGLWEHVLDIVVMGVAKVSADLDETLDDILAEVDTALFANLTTQTLTNRLKTLGPPQVSAIDIDDTLETRVGRITLRLAAVYHTAAGAPQTIL